MSDENKELEERLLIAEVMLNHAAEAMSDVVRAIGKAVAEEPEKMDTKRFDEKMRAASAGVLLWGMRMLAYRRKYGKPLTPDWLGEDESNGKMVN